MQIIEVISYFAKVRGRIIRVLSRTYADCKKSARVSRTFEDSFSPRKSAIGLSAIGLSAERDFIFSLILISVEVRSRGKVEMNKMLGMTKYIMELMNSE